MTITDSFPDGGMLLGCIILLSAVALSCEKKQMEEMPTPVESNIPSSTSLLTDAPEKALNITVSRDVDEWFVEDYSVLPDGRYRYVSDGTPDGSVSIYTICEGEIDSAADAIEAADALPLVRDEESCHADGSCDWWKSASDPHRTVWPRISAPASIGRTEHVPNDAKSYAALVEIVEPLVTKIDADRKTRECTTQEGEPE